MHRQFKEVACSGPYGTRVKTLNGRVKVDHDFPKENKDLIGSFPIVGGRALCDLSALNRPKLEKPVRPMIVWGIYTSKSGKIKALDLMWCSETPKSPWDSDLKGIRTETGHIVSIQTAEIVTVPYSPLYILDGNLYGSNLLKKNTEIIACRAIALWKGDATQTLAPDFEIPKTWTRHGFNFTPVLSRWPQKHDEPFPIAPDLAEPRIKGLTTGKVFHPPAVVIEEMMHKGAARAAAQWFAYEKPKTETAAPKVHATNDPEACALLRPPALID